MTKPDSTDAGGVTHHCGAGGGDEDGYDMTGSSGPTTFRDVRNFLQVHGPRFGKTALATMLRFLDQQESALATLTRERDGLRGAVLAILNYPGETARLRDAVGSILYDRLVSWLDTEPATPPAPLPGGQGQVEALRREIVEALDQFADSWHTDARILARQLSDRLEQGGEGREG